MPLGVETGVDTTPKPVMEEEDVVPDTQKRQLYGEGCKAGTAFSEQCSQLTHGVLTGRDPVDQIPHPHSPLSL
jgi:hypothetical protein